MQDRRESRLKRTIARTQTRITGFKEDRQDLDFGQADAQLESARRLLKNGDFDKVQRRCTQALETCRHLMGLPAPRQPHCHDVSPAEHRRA